MAVAVGVVVPADVDVGDTQGLDWLQQRILHTGPVVGDVTGVEDDIDVVLLDDRPHDRPDVRVEVDIRDEERTNRVGVPFQRWQVTRRRRQLRDVLDQPAQLLAVLFEVADDHVGVTDHLRDEHQQPGVVRLRQRAVVPRGCTSTGPNTRTPAAQTAVIACPPRTPPYNQHR